MTLLVGGARSGKSRLAVQLASASNLAVTFIATAQVIDEEMAERIARHRADRPSGWSTIEEPTELGRALEDADTDDTVIVDCLTLWVSNLMLDSRVESDIVKRAEEVARLTAQRAGPTIVVTNEVGSGVHPSSELGRQFRDVLGRVNSIWAEHADDVLLVVAGRTLALSRVEVPGPNDGSG